MSRQIKLKGQLTVQVMDIFSRATIYKSSHTQLLDGISQLRASDNWKLARNYVRDYVEGYVACSMQNLYTHYLEYAYDFRGKRYLLSDTEYKALSPVEVSNESTWHGYVWKADRTREFFKRRKQPFPEYVRFLAEPCV
jgi:hypothetical protein